jgi:diguanylate cyclase (GGDEF)-like protein
MAAPFRLSGNLEKTLDRLLSEAALQGFGLALYDSQGALLARCGPRNALCADPANALCSPACREIRSQEFAAGQDDPTPRLIACPAGLWHFLIPCRTDSDERCSLIAGGVRGSQINLPYLEEVAGNKALPASSLLEYWDQLPALPREKVLAAGETLRRILAEPETRQPASQPQAHTAGLIKALAEAETLLEQATSPEAIVNAVNKAFAPLYAPGQIALFLPKDGGDELDWLFPAGASEPARFGAGEHSRRHSQDGSPITCLPLQRLDELLGCLVLFVAPPCPSDLQLLKILAERVAVRLQQLSSAPASEKATEHPAEILLNRLKFLVTIKHRKTLCQKILETAASLVDAGKGSLMLFDDAVGKLRLQASIGMNRSMADDLSIRADHGIVGLVMHSGKPLLVQDMEKDQRILFAPRPRFRTRSLLCLPLQAPDGLLGVLNLADKQDDSPFTEADLESLSDLLEHCSPLIDRLTSRERLQQVAQESALDPITDVYNQPLLERRFSEEAGRCSRSRHGMALLLLAPDLPEGEADSPAGLDEALQLIASLLKGLLRRMDIVGRAGAGQFAILLSDTDREIARAIADRILITIAGQQSGKPLTASCGLALFPDNGATFGALLNSAGAALQQARSQGGNCTVACQPNPKNSKIVYL